ncbi:MAG: L,D-transpeptidase family protein [Oscillospiraceae bacterium]|nr:L,D-transpeptidase family protein [Oscillospiraceae bacterium]
MKKAVIIAALVCVLALLADAGAYVYDQHRRSVAYQEMADALDIQFDPAYSTAEYASAFDTADIIATHTGDLEILSTVDTSQLGRQTVQCRVTGTDEYGMTAQKEFSFDVEVTDTTPADITLRMEEVFFSEDMSFDPLVYVEGASDPVDGDLVFSEALEDGTYTVECDADTETPGEYRILVTARDQHGNESTAECKVTVLDHNISGKVYPYYIRINRELNTVTVFGTDSDGRAKTPLKAMVCSTGRATPLGTYRTYYKRQWNGLFGDVYGQYATGIVGDILFHSVPYYSINKGNLEYEEYNKLGTKASLGCVRMCVRDVKWVYDYCDVGTAVQFYDDAEDPGPLGKPEPITIDLEDERRGWDPTDPDPDNPWNN